ncbi:hypothetical protein NHX12_002586 [Muraenolepis orangiensis]|uniref:Complement C3 n=1 Tax=Muraenolepis orangiensis TaxID=630683 RepID=A0A9Q0E144_9TELE|nr:hypothetical protein NHX12_002586 [Muraenolepis orangiensis]
MTLAILAYLGPLLLLLIFITSTAANVAALKVLSAPNLLRVGAVENIFVECLGCSGANLDVQVLAKNFPTESNQLASAHVTLTSPNFQAFAKIKIPATDFINDPQLKQYVVLEARFSDGTILKKEVMVSFQAGYIFIQTDKPLYTPNTKVQYRMFGVTPSMAPISDDNDDASIINIHIVNNKHLNYSAEFEVKEYVLPSFEIKMTVERNFFYVEDKELSVDIQATYLFGQHVEGSTYVVFGIFDHNKEKHSLPASFQRLLLNKGKSKATLTREHILETYPEVENLTRSSIYVSVSVLTQSGSEMVDAEKQGIRIVKSPYTLHLTNTPKYFKPLMFFEVVVYAENPDGSPAPNLDLLVKPDLLAKTTVFATTGRNGIARVRTNNPQVSDDREASATMTTVAYSSTLKSYLHIGLGSSDVKIRDFLKVQLLRSNALTPDLTYLVQSRGQLVKFGRISSKLLSVVLLLQVTKEMMPSFRIVAFYHDRGEVVSDAIWVDVEATCMGSLKLGLKDESIPKIYRPGDTFHYKITGDPGATVGLVAVDKGVYVLNNKHRLTQKKVWDIVQRYDTGCTPGGGLNGMQVFADAGLLFRSQNLETDNRQELKCPVSATRAKRESHVQDLRTTLLSEFVEPLARQCCLDGMSDTPLSYSCARRREYVLDGKLCADAFLRCCEEMAKLKAESKTEALLLARSQNMDIEFKDIGEIRTRTEFPESWLWMQYKLPLCTKENCMTTFLEKEVPLKDSITTWHLTGISLSPTHGICIDDSFTIVVRKDFFLDLRLPYSAVRGEQIEVKAILHNYLSDEITAQVYLKEIPGVCSTASKRGQHVETVTVAAGGTLSVPFILIPMKHGRFPVEVKAWVAKRQLEDGVQRVLLVVVSFLTQEFFQKDDKQVATLYNPIEEKYIVPHTPRSSQIYVTGGSQMNVLVEHVLSGASMGQMIQQPSGCGEQNMMSLTLPLIATTYLDRTSQWDLVGFSKRAQALGFIKSGYQNELTYRTADGAFSTFKNDPGKSWLTSYVAKVFAMAYHLVDVDINIVCSAVKWVVLNSQMPDGSFKELGTIIHTEMIGGVRGSDASMTAFSLIAMQETLELCIERVGNMPGSIRKAVDYLEKVLPHLTNPYAVAMVSYALANDNKFNKETLYRFASPEKDHWPVSTSYLFTLEATAYALLALVKAKEFEDAKPIVKWLNIQKTSNGGFQSTQSTIMVYQALAEYWISAKEQQYKIDIEVQVPGRSNSESFGISNSNAFQTRTTKFNAINQAVNVTATGSGEATVSLVSMYYEMSASSQSGNCEQFDVRVELIPADSGDLNKLSKGRDRTISRYESNGAHSDRKSVIIYLNKVSYKQFEEVAFRINQQMPVGVLQPAVISVYEYYNQECSMQQKRNIDQVKRKEKACDPVAKIDYVYKVHMESFDDDSSIDTYKMRIEILIKEGYSHCRESLSLKPGSSYLLMGTLEDTEETVGNGFQYVLGERTWIEYWPSDPECQTDQHGPTCQGLEDLQDQMMNTGCRE